MKRVYSYLTLYNLTHSSNSLLVYGGGFAVMENMIMTKNYFSSIDGTTIFGTNSSGNGNLNVENYFTSYS